MTTIFSSTSAWVPQPDRTETRLSNGLHIVRQSFRFAGTPTSAPYETGDSWEGFKVYPQPEFAQFSPGLFSSTVTAYSIWQRMAGIPPTPFSVYQEKTSRILKTGILEWTQTDGDTTTIKNLEFEYLSPRVYTQVAAATAALPTPSEPGLIYSNQITVTRSPQVHNYQDKTWVLSSYEVENFGDYSVVSYTYEVLAKLYKTS